MIFDAPTLTTPKKGEERAYLGGAGFETPCEIKETKATTVIIEIKGVIYEMPHYTIGRVLGECHN